MSLGNEPYGQVQLDWIGQKAADMGISRAELLRRALDKYFLSSPDVRDEEVQAKMATYVERRYQL